MVQCVYRRMRASLRWVYIPHAHGGRSPRLQLTSHLSVSELLYVRRCAFLQLSNKRGGSSRRRRFRIDNEGAHPFVSMQRRLNPIKPCSIRPTWPDGRLAQLTAGGAFNRS